METLLSGITFSGGEPFVQAEPLCHPGRAVRRRQERPCAYSGHLRGIYSLAQRSRPWAVAGDKVDVLVDGPMWKPCAIWAGFPRRLNQRVLDRDAIEALRPVEA